MYRSLVWGVGLAAILGPAAGPGNDKNYVMVAFDAQGSLQDPEAWDKIKHQLKTESPTHVFMLAHGFKNSAATADKTFTKLAELLRQQQAPGETIQVIGLHWPSLLGDEDEKTGDVVKAATRYLADKLAQSDNVQERKQKLKELLKRKLARAGLVLIKLPIPEDLDTDVLIDQLGDAEDLEKVAVALSYYHMKKRANDVGATGVQACLTELQADLPKSRFHLVGHSFGCKVCLACVASKERVDTHIDSLTLLQGAVSMLCFASKIKALANEPSGAYVDLPKRVKGPIAVTYTKDDKALLHAYVAASQAGGHIGELPGRHSKFQTSLYGALGANGIEGVEGINKVMLTKGDTTTYQLIEGLNACNADGVIERHGDIRREEVARLIWAAARKP